MLEEYLRSGEAKAKSLSEIAGLKEAAQKVGGTATGLFVYDNNNETMRVWLESLKQSPDNVGKALGPVAALVGGAKTDNDLKDWFDVSLLPPFEKIAKYFHFTVYSGGVGVDGFQFKVFSPAPPQLRK
jgi:hypothetical protein